MKANLAHRRYKRAVLILMSGYVVLLLAVMNYSIAQGQQRGVLGVVLALLPALPLIGVFGAMARYLIEETDEYVRNRFVRQALIATGLTLSLCTAWGFLESFEIVPHVYAYYAAVLWFASQGVAATWAWLMSAARESEA